MSEVGLQERIVTVDQTARILVGYADGADAGWLDRLDAATIAAGGTKLALAQPSAISVFEGDWPGGAIGLWRLADGAAARHVATSAEAPAQGGFAVSVPELPGAAQPVAGAGLLLVQGLFTDAAKAAAYNRALPPIYARHGGFYLALARPDAIERVAGAWSPKAIVLAAFTSPAASNAFWRSDEYTAAKALRAGGGQFLVVAFEGC
jgi:uncharacterized protein (DUF1330 family)